MNWARVIRFPLLGISLGGEGAVRELGPEHGWEEVTYVTRSSRV